MFLIINKFCYLLLYPFSLCLLLLLFILFLRLRPTATQLSLWPAFKVVMRWSAFWLRDRLMWNTEPRWGDK